MRDFLASMLIAPDLIPRVLAVLAIFDANSFWVVEDESG